LKAGLDKAAWKDDRTDIFRFSALVIHERRTAAP
jgi:AMMECR1 domain-containing protein